MSDRKMEKYKSVNARKREEAVPAKPGTIEVESNRRQQADAGIRINSRVRNLQGMPTLRSKSTKKLDQYLLY